MSESKFSERKAKLRAEFLELDKEKNSLVEQRREIDKKLAIIGEQIIRRDAAYVELLNFEPDPKPEPKDPDEVITPELVTTH